MYIVDEEQITERTVDDPKVLNVHSLRGVVAGFSEVAMRKELGLGVQVIYHSIRVARVAGREHDQLVVLG